MKSKVCRVPETFASWFDRLSHPPNELFRLLERVNQGILPLEVMPEAAERISPSAVLAAVRASADRLILTVAMDR